jgi:hypothetical protein
MITTNSDIKNYSFYNPNNIYILDRKDVIIDKKFFNSEYQDIDFSTYNEFSIAGWIYSIFIANELKEWRKVN